MLLNEKDKIVVPRCILFVSQANVSEILVRRLEGAGWRVIQCGQENVSNVTFNLCRIGVVWLESYDPEFMHLWESISSKNHEIQWLALVNKSALVDDRLKDLILNRCHDFHTLPVDFDRFVVTLGFL